MSEFGLGLAALGFAAALYVIGYHHGAIMAIKGHRKDVADGKGWGWRIWYAPEEPYDERPPKEAGR